MSISRLDQYNLSILSRKKVKVSLSKTQIIELLEKSKYNKTLIPVLEYLLRIVTRKDIGWSELKILEGKINKNLVRQKNTLKDIKKILSQRKIEYLISKTARTIPYVTHDIDIVVKEKDFERTVEVFGLDGYRIGKHGTINGIKANWQITAKKDNQLLIDIHKNISWMGSEYLSFTDYWSNPGHQKFFGTTQPIPSKEVELIQVAANVLFEKFHLTLLDYLYLKKLIAFSKVGEVTRITEKYKWGNLFNDLMTAITDIERKDKPEIVSRVFKVDSDISFPIIVRFSYSIRIFLNRLFSGYGISLVAVIYVCYMYLKMYLKKGNFYPYYFSIK
ncbi:hypothetical protein A2686_04515 [Candidatus Woesebacteria bacterium RIFCSPHIGHO2_01_FULL_38_10]|uniref:Nucleotidyltransferase n=1 Tax=Candidatus Woesebacteria bacterium RIFCSPLOWO2_01_FULL_39_10b TaxID=1802517 RepID=A0A1F8B977_9BACT|nr:MAG: hypothetical protein A2686_04515 [Candidatus Woesebacteria bacterium RIFCSPHIGHO2_01_FULL_38_10]OGM60602.1 MAG: hypothetical protein A2892_00975 [Candidatus Woesebacteria bacterium RIFCSPLOWO2_01_FULL_39_10b]